MLGVSCACGGCQAPWFTCRFARFVATQAGPLLCKQTGDQDKEKRNEDQVDEGGREQSAGAGGGDGVWGTGTPLCFLDFGAWIRQFANTGGETNRPPAYSTYQPNHIMGDKSPKANQKKSAQKQVKASSASQAKKQAESVRQAGSKK
jgi:hypothetical protein